MRQSKRSSRASTEARRQKLLLNLIMVSVQLFAIFAIYAIIIQRDGAAVFLTLSVLLEALILRDIIKNNHARKFKKLQGGVGVLTIPILIVGIVSFVYTMNSMDIGQPILVVISSQEEMLDSYKNNPGKLVYVDAIISKKNSTWWGDCVIDTRGGKVQGISPMLIDLNDGPVEVIRHLSLKRHNRETWPWKGMSSRYQCLEAGSHVSIKGYFQGSRRWDGTPGSVRLEAYDIHIGYTETRKVKSSDEIQEDIVWSALMVKVSLPILGIFILIFSYYALVLFRLWKR